VLLVLLGIPGRYARIPNLMTTTRAVYVTSSVLTIAAVTSHGSRSQCAATRSRSRKSSAPPIATPSYGSPPPKARGGRDVITSSSGPPPAAVSAAERGTLHGALVLVEREEAERTGIRDERQHRLEHVLLVFPIGV